jgi:hypothetical protein
VYFVCVCVCVCCVSLCRRRLTYRSKVDVDELDVADEAEQQATRLAAAGEESTAYPVRGGEERVRRCCDTARCRLRVCLHVLYSFRHFFPPRTRLAMRLFPGRRRQR